MPELPFPFQKGTPTLSADHHVLFCFDDAPAKHAKAHSAHMTRLQPALAWSPQYIRAWRKYVEQDSTYKDVWVSPHELQAPEKLHFSLIPWRLDNEPTLPKLSIQDAEFVFSLPDLLEAHLDVRGRDRDSRANVTFCSCCWRNPLTLDRQ
ncbi:hypothetical protein BCR37DRAFT_382125 [Protomyces lactucae-debilis]|uniref:Uncharacterized protein n=1 Tax=Protomyces lactucae-debilis TaxID=2754530 RepID=A0A1Y2F4T6_PROLT|nr:uncharacterized protein BCR37DRAFT_382125 [Protomyces lactucae-debilis]ORY78494.1 hypothetical protein BCR37DRAFT_382125 [Protomyces lactucae-debilis]